MLGVTRLHAGRGGSAGRQALDYYLVYPQTPQGEHPRQPEGIVVEEFVLDADYSAVCLNSTGWTSKDCRWWSPSAFSRAMRVDTSLRSRVVPTARHEAEAIYRRLGGDELPDEKTLRAYFNDGEPLSTSPPLRLSPDQVTAGFYETRVYRILFANGLGKDGVADLRGAWRMKIIGDVADPQARVIGTGHLRVGDDAFTWDLRRIGAGAAWCVDLTADLAGSCGDAIGSVLRALTTGLREQGLIPVTIERFS